MWCLGKARKLGNQRDFCTAGNKKQKNTVRENKIQSCYLKLVRSYTFGNKDYCS
jgi:hypothetical protein